MAKWLTEDRARRAFNSQKKGAENRGIGWEFTFDEWLLWWGDDIKYRGRHRGNLQMQRIADTGPYRADNVKKGNPAQNRKTHKIQVRNRKTVEAGIKHQQALDALPVVADELEEEPKSGYFSMWDRLERDAVRSYDGDDAPIQRKDYISDGEHFKD